MKRLIPIFIFITTLSALANSVSIKDTNATKGQVISIPVYANITDNLYYLEAGNKFSIDFEYNALMLDVKEIVINGETLVQSQTPTMTNQLNNSNFRKSTLNVKFDQKVGVSEGILFFIKAEVLAGPDTICTIAPTSLTLRDSSILTQFNLGKIRIPEPVSEIDKSYLGNFYPNPFHRYSKATLKISIPSRIKIATYNIGGRDVLSDFCNGDCIEKHFRLTDGAGVEYKGDELLLPGDYLLEIKNDYSTLSAGAYLVVIQTDYRVLTQRFVVIK